MKINSKIIALSLIVIIFGGIFISDSLGFWITESTKVPVKYNEGEFEGQYNPADIRGSYTLADIENSFNVEPLIIAEAFGISDTIANLDDFQVKEFESIYANIGDVEIGTDTVRIFVSLYTGLPYEVEERVLPIPAVMLLYTDGKIDETLKNELLAIAVDISEVSVTESEDADTAEDVSEDTTEAATTEESIVNGKTIINDLYSKGLTEEQIVEVLGIKPSNKNQSLRDFCTENGLTFSEIKDEFIKLLE